MAPSIKIFSKEILYLIVKTIGVAGLVVSYATSISTEVIQIEGGKLNSIVNVYKTDTTLEKSKLVLMFHQVMKILFVWE